MPKERSGEKGVNYTTALRMLREQRAAQAPATTAPVTEQYDEWADGGQEAAEEWAAGQCDNCTGSTAEELQRAAEGGIIPVCACAIGQGAAAEACVCGPGGDV